MTRDELDTAVTGVVRSLSGLIGRDAIPAAMETMAPLWDRREAGTIGEYVIRDLFAGERQFRLHVESVGYDALVETDE